MDDYLMHYGIKGMKWGVRKKRPVSGEVLFVSGSSKTQDKSSPYYRRRLPKYVRQELKGSMRRGDTIIVGDAPGIDRQTQDYLKKKRYSNVEVYGPGTQVRYSANVKWKTNPINDPDHEPMSKEWLAKKDVAMTNRATKGLAVILDEGSSATRNNVERLVRQNKVTGIYEIHKKRPHQLIKGLSLPEDQRVIYWGESDPQYKYNKGWNIAGHNYAIRYRGERYGKVRNQL